jgi:hypothetical protein
MNDIRKIDMNKQQLYPLYQLHSARKVLKEVGGLTDNEVGSLIAYGQCTCYVANQTALTQLCGMLEGLGLRFTVGMTNSEYEDERRYYATVSL